MCGYTRAVESVCVEGRGHPAADSFLPSRVFQEPTSGSWAQGWTPLPAGPSHLPRTMAEEETDLKVHVSEAFMYKGRG